MVFITATGSQVVQSLKQEWRSVMMDAAMLFWGTIIGLWSFGPEKLLGTQRLVRFPVLLEFLPWLLSVTDCHQEM